MLTNLNSEQEVNWDWFLLVAKTGMRFSEALALTPRDFNFTHQMLSISKTWNYKDDGGFLPTKNQSSVIHGLRHTHASLLLFAGVSIASVARRLGHASMTTT